MAFGLKKSLLLTATLTLISCGGGSSAPLPPVAIAPPPPPPPQAQAPVVNVTTISSSAEEGQSITLDASGTTDPDTDTSALTFTWTQLSGVNANILSPNDPVTEIILPEITANETVEFSLTVSDGQNEAAETVGIETTNIFQSPRSSFDVLTTISSQAVMTGSRVISDNQFLSSPTMTPPDGINQISRLILSNNNDNDSLTAVLENVEISETADKITITESDLGIFTLSSIDEDNNTVSLFTGNSTAPNTTEFLGNIPIDGPCDIDNITDGGFVRQTIDSGGNQAAINIIGQRNSGFEIIAPIFSAENPEIMDVASLQSVGADESYCFVDFVDGLSAGITRLDNNIFSSPLGGVIVAVDYENQTIDLFRDNTQLASEGADFIVGTTNNPQYERVLSEPLLPDGNDTNLDIVDIHRSQSSPGTFIVLMSDGTHIGDHRAIVLTVEPQDNSGSTEDVLGFTRGDMAWPRGVPQNATFAPLRSETTFDRIDTLIINSSSSPEAIVFQREANSDFTSFEGPSFFELGLDVDAIQLQPFTSPTTNAESARILVHIPERDVLEVREN